MLGSPTRTASAQSAWARWRTPRPDADPFDGGVLGSVFRGAFRTVAALAIATTASITVVVIGQPVTDALGLLVLGPGAYAEYAGAGFVAALLWVLTGAQVVPRGRSRHWLSLLLFAAGACAAWRLIGTGFATSHCSGLTEVAASYTGGGIGVMLAGLENREGRLRPSRFALIAGMLLTIGAFGAVAARAWLAPPLGVLTYAHIGLDRRVDVRRVHLPPDGTAGGEEIVWASGSAADELAGAAQSGSIIIERDLGSGGSRARVTSVPNVRVQSRVEDALRMALPALIAWEITQGYAPPACARLPLPTIDVSRARFFRVIETP